MLKLLYRMTLSALFGLWCVSTSWAAEAQQEHPLFSKLEGFALSSSKSTKFDSVKFQLKNEKVTVEGKSFDIRYKLQKGQEAPGGVHITRNFTQAVQRAGGEVLYETKDNAVMRLKQDRQEIWVRIRTAANGAWYYLDIVEKADLQQEVVVNKLLDAINATGRATVYINFDTASAHIKPDAKPVIDDILDMLQKSPALKISIEGHTDSDGNTDANQKLSLERAQSVQAALIRQGVSATRLGSKGFGQSKPVADNKSEDGKAKNRRVELVKVS
jgi:OOP family OmpA-OmpF porin